MREGPDHYTRLKPEPTDVIVAWDLPWRIANVVKYCARYRFKNGVEDLKKARHYLDMEIEAMEQVAREVKASQERMDSEWVRMGSGWPYGRTIT